MTADLFGVPWKIKMDNYNIDRDFISDLKVMAGLHDRFYDEEYRRYVNFIEHYKYNFQMCLYSEVERLATGRADNVDTFLVVVTKEEPCDKAVFTGFNDDKVFAGILDSGTGAAYSSEGRRSYPLDLRLALETTDTMNDAAEFMRDSKKLYAYNHIIGFSDPDSSIILENNFSGNGSQGNRVKRAIRKSDSKLNKNITWGISDAVAAVNCFMLYGNNDNYTPNKYNTKRWKSIKNKLNGDGSTVSIDEVRQSISYYRGSSPGMFSENGDIYNKMTILMVLFQPDSLSLEVFFRPKDNRVNPAHPVFEKISVFQ
jgi:hypothetical protein